MKFLTIFLSLSLASVALAQEPAELVKLRNSWESQLDATKEKIDTLYFSELEELKKNFLKDHNLKNAQAVQREIDRDNRAANEPAELNKMRKTYQNSISSAINELNKSYYKNLKNIQKDYMDAADLRQATAVEREIERLRTRHAKPADPPKKKTVKGSSGLRESGEISNKAGQSLRLKGNAVYYHKDANHVGVGFIFKLGQPKPIFMDINDNGDWIIAVSRSMRHGQGTTSKHLRLSEKPIIGGAVKINRNGEWLCAAGYTINLGRKLDKRLEIKKFDKRISSAEAKVSDLGNWEVEGKLENGRSFKETGRMPTSW